MDTFNGFLNRNKFTMKNGDCAFRNFDCGVTVNIRGLTKGFCYIECEVVSPVKTSVKPWFIWAKDDMESEAHIRSRFVPFLEYHMLAVIRDAYGTEVARRAASRGFYWVYMTRNEGKNGQNDPNM